MVEVLPQWRNWQTRYVQGVVGNSPWGFKSLLRHRRGFGQLAQSLFFWYTAAHILGMQGSSLLSLAIGERVWLLPLVNQKQAPEKMDHNLALN